MTSNLIVTSLQPGIGKTTFTLGLVRKYKLEGKNVGYFKPVTDRVEDSDPENAKELLEMDEGVVEICPVTISTFEYDMTDEQKSESWNKIESAFEKLNAKYDFLVIESCRTLNYLSFLGFSVNELAKKMDAKILLLASGTSTEDADSLILMAEYLRSKTLEIVGGVFTLVPGEYFDHMATVICPKLKSTHQIDMFGMVPERTNLVAPTVEEISKTLDATVIAGKPYMSNLVENTVVGAMEPETALKYFRRSINKAVITGGDRPQVAIAALETDTSVLILTGSILPPATVLAKAEDRKIPILSVAMDTFSTIKILTSQSLYGRLHLHHKDRLEAWDKVMNEVDCQGIYNSL